MPEHAMSARSSRLVAQAIAAAALLAISIGMGPAGAEVANKVRDCDRQSCPYHEPMISVPDGWVHDVGAERSLHFQTLVPNGKNFLATDAVIFAHALPKTGRTSISDHIMENQMSFRAREPHLKIIDLPDVARANGKQGFRLVQYEKPSSPGQIELIATTIDTDRDGNPFFVDISLTVQSVEALNAARA